MADWGGEAGVEAAGGMFGRTYLRRCSYLFMSVHVQLLRLRRPSLGGYHSQALSIPREFSPEYRTLAPRVSDL